MDFACKQKDFCQRRTRFFGVKCPSAGVLSLPSNNMALPKNNAMISTPVGSKKLC